MYAKLFQQLLSSSLTEHEPIEVRGVFFMLMAAADKSGHVLGSDETIARIINVPVDVTKRAIVALMKPDPDSRNEEHDGRRLIPLERSLGYFLTGYPKYSGIKTDEERREYFRIKQRESRERRGVASVAATTKESQPAEPDSPPDSTQDAKPQWEVSHGLSLPEKLQSENCLLAVKKWLQYKKEIGDKYGKTGLQSALTKWSNEFTAAEFPTAVEHSIASGWKGIFKARNGAVPSPESETPEAVAAKWKDRNYTPLPVTTEESKLIYG